MNPSTNPTAPEACSHPVCGLQSGACQSGGCMLMAGLHRVVPSVQPLRSVPLRTAPARACITVPPASTRTDHRLRAVFWRGYLASLALAAVVLVAWFVR